MSMRLSYELYNISYDKLIDYYYVIPYLYKKKRKKERWDQLSCLWWEKNADRAFSSRAWMAQISVTFCLEGPASSLCHYLLGFEDKMQGQLSRHKKVLPTRTNWREMIRDIKRVGLAHNQTVQTRN